MLKVCGGGASLLHKKGFTSLISPNEFVWSWLMETINVVNEVSMPTLIHFWVATVITNDFLQPVLIVHDRVSNADLRVPPAWKK